VEPADLAAPSQNRTSPMLYLVGTMIDWGTCRAEQAIRRFAGDNGMAWGSISRRVRDTSTQVDRDRSLVDQDACGFTYARFGLQIWSS
jgi:hypothetical protein